MIRPPFHASSVEQKKKQAKLATAKVITEISVNFEAVLVEAQVKIWHDIFEKVVTTMKKGSMGYSKTMLGYKTSLLQWLLTYFNLDEAEKERTYLLFHLKKPDCQPIKPFALHLEQLNAYIQRLPCLKDMPEGVSNSMIT